LNFDSFVFLGIKCSEDPYADSNHTTTNFETTSTESYRDFIVNYRYGYNHQANSYGYWTTSYRIAVQSKNV